MERRKAVTAAAAASATFLLGAAGLTANATILGDHGSDGVGTIDPVVVPLDRPAASTTDVPASTAADAPGSAIAGTPSSAVPVPAPTSSPGVAPVGGGGVLPSGNMTSASVGHANMHASHWMQSWKRSTRLLFWTRSSTFVGHTATHASQPVQQSSLMS